MDRGRAGDQPRLGPYPTTVDKELRPKLCPFAPEACATTHSMRERHVHMHPTGTTPSACLAREDALLAVDMEPLVPSDAESSMDVPSEEPASAEGAVAEGVLPIMGKGAHSAWWRLTRAGLHHEAWRAIFDRVLMSRCVLVPPAHTQTGYIRAALLYNEVSPADMCLHPCRATGSMHLSEPQQVMGRRCDCGYPM